MGKSKVTINDIARELGLSKSTVSRALTDSWEINQKTRQAVLAKAAEMNYHPNAQARGLVTRRTHIIGYVVPDLLSSTYFTKVARSIQDVLLEHGYQLLITQSNESLEEERRLLRMMMGLNVDGIIISTVKDSDYNREIFNEIIAEGTALTFISRVCKSVPVPKIVVDNYEMAAKIVDHLVEQGCNRIAYISGPKGILSDDRESGYLTGLERNHLAADPDMIMESGLSMEEGYDATLRLLDAGKTPDGIFAVNDNVAFGVIKALKDRGLRIPEDVAVCGFSNSFAAPLVDPPLSSTAPPLEEMGRVSAEEILHQISGFAPADKTIVLESELCLRSSSQRSIPQK